MWQRLISATHALSIVLWVFLHLLSAHATQVTTAPDADNAALAALFGRYALTATEKYRGSVTTADEIRLRFGTELRILPDRFTIGSETWPKPRYRLQSHPILFKEGEVQQGRWSNFFGYGMDRKTIDVLEIHQPDPQSQPRQYNLEVITNDEIWFLYDGWLLRYTRKARVTK